MDGALKPYPEYRDSGLSWIGRIPAHWEVRRAKGLFREKDVRSMTGDEEVLSVSHLTGITPRSEKNINMFEPESYEGHKLCQSGDLVINTMWAWMGALGISRYEGVVSPSYGVYSPRKDSLLLAGYADYLLRDPCYISEYTCRSTGIRSSRLRLYPDDFLRIPVLCPPPHEQKAIADYLDRKHQEIQLYIQNKQRLIVLLNEDKLAVVSQAVTKGLDINARLKPTDHLLFSDIPDHWQMVKLKNIAKVVLGKMLKSTPSPGEELKFYLRSANVQWFHPDLQDVAEMWFTRDELESYRLHVDDILVSEGGEVGRACIWKAEIPECYIQNSVHKITLTGAVRPLFLLYQLLCLGKGGYFHSIVNRVSIAHLTREKFVDVKFLVPPLEEQDRINHHIKDELSRIDAAINLVQRQIALMQEYRTALISEAVTGGVDVRGVRQTGKVLPLRKRNVHFCRSVLAAEIVDRHQDTPRFGWIKLQKAMILVERHLQLDDIESRPLRAAAGPFDNPMMRSIHAQLEHQKWFKPVKTEMGLEYRPMEKRGEHRKYFDRYWGDKREQFDRLMALVKPMKTEQAEIVATLYMAWNDFMIRGESFDDDRLVDEVLHHWDESKRRISEERWRLAISWMREKGLTPVGFGALTVRGSGTVDDGDDRYE